MTFIQVVMRKKIEFQSVHRPKNEIGSFILFDTVNPLKLCIPYLHLTPFQKKVCMDFIMFTFKVGKLLNSLSLFVFFCKNQRIFKYKSKRH